MDNEELNKIEEGINSKNAVEDRMQKLVGGKKEAEAKQAEAEAKAKEAQEKLAVMEKETNFLNSFSESITKYPQATQFKDKIKEKVFAGYSFEDATVAILHSEGKLGNQSREGTAGGSAPTQITNQGTKSVAEMKSDERWAQIAQMEKEGVIGLQ